MSIKELENMLALQTNKVQKNTKILSPKDLGQDYVLRIDPQQMNRKPFTPMIAYRQADSEDRTMPRVVASPYLLGCIHAYPNIIDSTIAHFDDGSNKYGWYIHALEFEYCLKPNSSLVFDANYTDEVWLVRYNDDTINYKATIAGKAFIHSVEVLPQIQKYGNKYALEIWIEVVKKDGLSFNNRLHLDKGYHSIKMEYGNATNKSESGIEHKPITEEEFTTGKKYQATLESMPLFIKW